MWVEEIPYLLFCEGLCASERKESDGKTERAAGETSTKWSRWCKDTVRELLGSMALKKN